MTPDPERVAELAEIRHRLHERIEAAGGSTAAVRIVAVSKTRPAGDVVAALAAGFSDLGESYAAEFAAKAGEVAAAREELGLRHPHWHFIGQLQTNKVRVIAPFAPLVQSVDRPSLVAELARRIPGCPVLVQVDLAGVAGRGGVAPADAPALIERAWAAGLDVQGVMGVAPLEGGEVAAGAAFGLLRGIRDAEGLAECSMGMSGDLEIAVAEGSTMVRIGTDIFGSRPPVRS